MTLFHKHMRPLNGRWFTDRESWAINRKDAAMYTECVREHCEQVQQEMDEMRRNRFKPWKW